jgi:hypothetical protein
MKLGVFGAAIASLLLIAGASFAKEQAPKSNSFDVTVFDKTNNRVLHKEHFTFAPEGDNGTYVKLIHQIGDFFGGGLQFSLMLHPDSTYEAFISPVPGGKAVSSGITSSKKIEVFMEWNKTAYTFTAKRL